MTSIAMIRLTLPSPPAQVPPMSRIKLLVSVLVIALTAWQVLAPVQGWYSPFVAAFGIILLLALIQSQGSGDEY